MALDITERKQAEAALRESEAKFRRIFENVQDIYFQTGLDSAIVDIGPAVERFGYARKELIGTPALDLYENPEQRAAFVRALVEHQEVTDYEIRLRTGLGWVADASISARALRDADGRPVGFEGTIRDVTTRKRMEEALRRSGRELSVRNRIASIFGTTPDEEVYAEVLQVVLEALGSRHGLFGYIDQDGALVCPSLTRDIWDQCQVPGKDIVFPPETWGGIWGRALTEKKDFYSNEPFHVPEGHIPVSRALDVPIVHQGRVIGNLMVGNKETDYNEQDLDLAKAIAGTIAPILSARLQRSRHERDREKAEEALRQQKETAQHYLDVAEVMLMALDEKGEVTLLNRRGHELLGCEDEDIVGKNWFDEFVPEALRDQVKEVFRGLVAGQLEPLEYYENPVLTRSGEETLVAWHNALLRDPAGKIVGTLSSGEDITERKHAEKALRDSEERFRRLASVGFEGIVIHEDGRVIDANEAFAKLFGYEVSEVLGMRVLELIAAESLDTARRLMPLRERRTTEVAGRRKDGSTFPMEVHGMAISSHGPLTKVAAVRDITERKRAEEALRERARRDPLTGALNHAAISGVLRELCASADGPVAVAMVDVDGMKATNDTYGHPVGDQVLVSLVSKLQSDGATVGHYGGDEFVVVLPGADRVAAERYRDSALDKLADLHLSDPETGARVPVAASIGLAVFPEEAHDPADLVRLADSAMYASRRERPVPEGTVSSSQPLGSDRAAEMVGQMVPLLTSPGDLNNKLKLVAHRLSVGAGYDGVDFSLFGAASGPPDMQGTVARLPEEIVQAWNQEQHADHSPEPNVLRPLLERIKRPLILDDPGNEERLWESQRHILSAAGLRSALIAPMIWQDQLVGMLSVASKRQGAFGPRDAQFLAAVATQVTAIVRMATLVDDLQSATNRLAQAQSDTVMLLAAAAEAHDRTTGLHLHGVRTLSEALARELGYAGDDAADLGLAAVLHDIGKIRVPDTVLASPGPLPDHDWEIMKRHTTWGAEFLAGRPGFGLAYTIALYHHERWDRAGYPQGLSGDAIPEAATIVTVADSFDAMTHDRPYLSRRLIDQAVGEIGACSGKQFSPNVVAALQHLQQQGALVSASTSVSDQEAAA